MNTKATRTRYMDENKPLTVRDQHNTGAVFPPNIAEQVSRLFRTGKSFLEYKKRKVAYVLENPQKELFD